MQIFYLFILYSSLCFFLHALVVYHSSGSHGLPLIVEKDHVFPFSCLRSPPPRQAPHK